MTTHPREPHDTSSQASPSRDRAVHLPGLTLRMRPTRQHGTLAVLVVVTLCVLLAPRVALGTEGGASAKALGVDTVLCGVMPAPGLVFTGFVTQYDASHTLDSSGNDRRGITTFRLRGDFATFRFQQIWSGVELWGANVETRIGFTPYPVTHLQFDVQTPNGKIHKEGSSRGIGDTLIGPVLLGWHGERFHQIIGPEFFVPTGTFDKDRLVNPSRGYYSLAPAYFYTWFPTDDIEFSGNVFYLFNGKNHYTNYRSGQELSIDYGISYAVSQNWQVGAAGNEYQQTTDDRLNGQIVGDGNRARVFSIGPSVRYHEERNWAVTLKWQHEMLVENRTRGDRFLLQFAFRLL